MNYCKNLVALTAGVMVLSVGTIVRASSFNSSEIQSSIQASNPLLVAQASGCPRAQPVTSFETRRYFIYICQGQNNWLFYRGVNKRNGQAINVGATYNSDNSYTAKNGNTTYQISREGGLLVYQGDRLILEEPVLREF